MKIYKIFIFLCFINALFADDFFIKETKKQDSNNPNLWDKKNQKGEMPTIQSMNADSIVSKNIESNSQNIESKATQTMQESQQKEFIPTIKYDENSTLDSKNELTKEQEKLENLKQKDNEILAEDSKKMQKKLENLESKEAQKLQKEAQNLAKKEQKALQKEQEKEQKALLKAKQKELKEQEKQQKLLAKAAKNKKHITSGRNIQEVKLKRDFGILGSSMSLGANYEMLGLRAAWSAPNTASPTQIQTFATNIKMQNLGLTWGYQFIGYKLHLLAETRLNASYNLAQSDLDVLLGGDILLGYYFPFNRFSGIALKGGGGISFGFNSKKVSEMVQNEAFSAVTSRDILTLFGAASKVGFELNVTRFSVGAYFVYYHFYMATFENLSDNFTPQNANANAKSGGYGIQATFTYRFKKGNTHLYDLQH